MDHSKILKYTLASSLINTAAITGLLVYLGMDDTNSNKEKIAVVAKENTNKENKPATKDKECKDEKPKKKSDKPKVVKKPKPKKAPKEAKIEKPVPTKINPTPKPQCKKKVICIRNMHGKHCRKPDVQSIPADFKRYYNYDPINRRWIWRG